jgi:protein TonB
MSPDGGWFITKGSLEMYMYGQPSSSRRVAGIAFVVLLHAVIIYALLTGLGRQVADILRAPIETKLIEEIKPPVPEVPPLAPPQLAAPPPPYIPPPEIQLRQPTPPKAVSAVSREKPAENPPPIQAPSAPVPVRVAPTVEVGKSCRTPEYPAASKLMAETGTVVLRFLVDIDGKVLESQVENSSGHPRLDEAARAALSLCQFKAGTADGKPERSWTRLRYVWKMG